MIFFETDSQDLTDNKMFKFPFSYAVKKLIYLWF